MKRDLCGKTLRALLAPEALVYCSLGSAGRTWRAQEATQPTYYSSDPMGMALPAALGLALAQPTRQVLFIGGDGDFVMSLGCLLTIAGVAPANLKLLVFDNGRYETGGGQPLAGTGRYDLAAIARGAGVPWAESVAESAAARDTFQRFLGAPGLAFLAVGIDAEPSPYPPAPPLAQVEERTEFMRRLAEHVPAAAAPPEKSSEEGMQ
jgi:thiamine pyrophosphate-dependent acetolactate synthase large subunit-like protein